MMTVLELYWHDTRSGNFVTTHPRTGETATVFLNKHGRWSGVCGGEFISGYFETAEDACKQMERWFAGVNVPTWRPG
jgi:hypothetical protein